MSNYCKSIEKVYQPTVISPSDQFFGMWVGEYNICSGSPLSRGSEILDVSGTISRKAAEKSFNHRLVLRWRFENPFWI